MIWRRELHGHDDLAVRYHHADAAEEHLEILRQLLSPGVAWIHGDEVPNGSNEPNQDRLAWKAERLEILLFRKADRLDLHRHDAKDLEIDAVELVEATPQSGLAQALEDGGHVAHAVLVGTVRHDDVDSEGSPHILGRLSLPRASRTSRRTSKEHTQRLGESQVAAVSKRRNTEALLAAEVLVREDEVYVRDGNDAMVRLGFPEEARLLEPLEVLVVLHLMGLDLLPEVLEDVLLVHLNRHERLKFRAIHLAAKVRQASSDKIRQNLALLLARRGHDCLIALAAELVQRFSAVRGPDELDAEQADHANVTVAVLDNRHAVQHSASVVTGEARFAADRFLHLRLKGKQPVLNVSLAHHGLGELHDLLGRAGHVEDVRDFPPVVLVEADTRNGV